MCVSAKAARRAHNCLERIVVRLMQVARLQATDNVCMRHVKQGLPLILLNRDLPKIRDLRNSTAAQIIASATHDT